MTHVVFDEGYHALTFGQQKINLHDAAEPFRPHAGHVAPGGFDVCLLTESPIIDVVAHLRSHLVDIVDIVDGPCPQTGALGPMTSLYFNDPDGNLIEIANYGDVGSS